MAANRVLGFSIMLLAFPFIFLPDYWPVGVPFLALGLMFIMRMV